MERHNNVKNILFITGTRADYGKIKSLMSAVSKDENYNLNIFVTGMHMLSKYGSTYHELEKDSFKNIYRYFNQSQSTPMDQVLSNTIIGISYYISENHIDMIVVHGDRVEALAGAIVGALNNILVAHIEGGEISGTIDESIRHAISKFSHIHFVANHNAKKRLIQLGEFEDFIHIIGSPDIDIMLSNKLPKLETTFKKYNIHFKNYAILMFHPVTTEFDKMKHYISNLVEAIIDSKINYIVVYPNNDLGSDVIINEYKRLLKLSNIKIFPSLNFEHFLTLLKHCDFIIGNSSAGVREAGVYNKKSINIGTRQNGRNNNDKNIINTSYDYSEIINSISSINHLKAQTDSSFGMGNSSELFMDVLKNKKVFEKNIQKSFKDMD